MLLSKHTWAFRTMLLILWLHHSTWKTGDAIHEECSEVAQLKTAQEHCSQARRQELRNNSTAPVCRTEWDEIWCWHGADVGQVVNVSCFEVSQLFDKNYGFIYRNCTTTGWSDLYPSYEIACKFQDISPENGMTYYFTMTQVYTAGYATSLISLISAIFVFTALRKFHCTRNYIHINLFSSFVLRASAVFIKDAVLFTDETQDHCSMSTASCKAAVAFFQFSILANYFWLLVEGMYLQTLLALTFVSQKKYFWWYILIGWGLPTTVLTIWVLVRKLYDDRGCWDDTEVALNWWIIKGPITASLLGFVVALLYCFLNGEVQAELKKRLWKWQMQGYLSYSKRRRTLFTESSTITQISVLEKSSPKEQVSADLNHSVSADLNHSVSAV
ncbi:vasoactive intestinal polypeptide receptor 1 isoform X3 [Brachyhypopomus gauderio]|uniref:vasoactive intestinal polypeptide receptor 1 isoform X3 n=1 Tax=Brachyhypopomus gauderio TaxID=698409 RepID=UPI0040413BAC